MIRCLFLLMCLGTAVFSIQAQDRHVLFGDHPTEDMAVYMDANGYPYPDYPIQNDSLRKVGSTLHNYYVSYPNEYRSISREYGIVVNSIDEKSFEQLNAAIFKRISARVNAKNAERGTVTAMVHGFRKPYQSLNHDMCSPEEYRGLQDALKRAGDRSVVYVEVYWDGMYDCCFSMSPKKNRPMFAMFEEAQRNAIPVGQQLRRLLTAIGTDTLNLYSHSLGAKVLTHCLWDPLDVDIPTPSQRCVNICLIAPAISSEEVLWNHYLKRRATRTLEWNEDNYHLKICYNKKDFVLRKKDFAIGIFGPGAYKYGNTTLGCNKRKCAEDLYAHVSKVHFPGRIELFNFESTGKCHHLYCYCRNPLFKELVRSTMSKYPL
jgi:hypothetical protein